MSKLAREHDKRWGGRQGETSWGSSDPTPEVFALFGLPKHVTAPECRLADDRLYVNTSRRIGVAASLKGDADQREGRHGRLATELHSHEWRSSRFLSMETVTLRSCGCFSPRRL